MKLRSNSLKVALLGLLGTVLAVPSMVLAAPAGPDWTELTDAIDFGDLATGLFAGGAALIGVYLVIKGVRIIVGMVRGG